MAEPTARRVIRFSRAEHAVHRTLAILMLTCIATAAILYNSFLAVPVGHRRLVKLIHVYSGFALLVPVVLGALSAAYRSDLGRLNRFSGRDWKWLRSRNRRDGSIPVGKFNAGQKLNSSLSVGGIIVMLATGIVMYFPALTRLSWRTGASFVHDWFALALGLLIFGHVMFATRDPEARRGMRHGDVDLAWARKHHPLWSAEHEPDADAADGRHPAAVPKP